MPKRPSKGGAVGRLSTSAHVSNGKGLLSILVFVSRSFSLAATKWLRTTTLGPQIKWTGPEVVLFWGSYFVLIRPYRAPLNWHFVEGVNS